MSQIKNPTCVQGFDFEKAEREGPKLQAALEKLGLERRPKSPEIMKRDADVLARLEAAPLA